MKVQRDQKKSIRHAKNLERLSDIIKHRRAKLPVLGGDAHYAEVIFDFSHKAAEEQVFMLRIPNVKLKKPKQDIELIISKQAWEHISRAI